MNKTGFLYDTRYLLHETGPYHPEIPERLQAIHSGIQKADLLDDLIPIKVTPVDMQWIERVHTKEYIGRFADACFAGHKAFSCPDNQMCEHTYDTALLAVGGVLEAVRRVMDGELDNAFCAVRPPGHHAEVDEAMGFCYFNNIAIAARYIQQSYGIERVGIIDFDVHHGNGTQHIFEKDPTVFYYSIHEHPTFAYPGTGREFEQGSGKGFGYTKNTPMLPGQSDAEYEQMIDQDMIPAFDGFKPEVMLISTGFDAHVDDDMSGIQLTNKGFSWIMERIMEMAQKHCGGRLISVLEGGYSLERLPELAGDHVRLLLAK